MDLPTFEDRCAKCGLHCFGDRGDPNHGRKWVKKGKDEYIEFKCQCGYQWRTATYDAVQEKKK